MTALRRVDPELVVEALAPEAEADATSFWAPATGVDAAGSSFGVLSTAADTESNLALAPPAPTQGEPPALPAYRIEWEQVDVAAIEALTTELVSDDPTLLVHNDGDVDVDVDVRVLGDAGTTVEYVVHEAKLVVAAKSTALVQPKLAALLEGGDFEYSGHLRATAVFTAVGATPDDEPNEGEPKGTEGDVLAQESSGSLFFHPAGDGGVVVYNHAALEQEFGAGDLLDQHDLAAEAVVEPTYTYRILGFAEQKEYAEEEADADAEGASLEGRKAIEAPAAEAEGAPLAPNGVGLPPIEDMQTYTACFGWEIQTVDSNELTWRNEHEDKWVNADTGIVVPAYRVRVKIGLHTHDTDADGCVTFQSASSTHDVRVYELVKNAYDTEARMHTGGPNLGSTYPGATYSWFIPNVPFVANGTKHLYVGDYIERTTGMAVLGYALSRYAYGVSHSRYHVTPDMPETPFAVAEHYGSAWPPGGDYDLAYLKFSPSKLDEKFTVAHEYGHAFGNFFVPQAMFSTNYNYDATNSGCYANGLHTKGSMEWSMDAAWEGWADFVSAMVWNDKAETGSFTGFDLESWEEGGYYGGREENVCLPCPTCPGAGAGTGNEIDWMLAFWDFYTDDPTECSNPPTSTDVARFMGEIEQQGPGGGFPDHPHGRDVSSAAADEVAAQGHIGACFAERWYQKGILGIWSISHYNGLRQAYP